MTKEEAVEWLLIFEGIANGGELQFNIGGAENPRWVKSECPAIGSPREYRIKPAVKLRPWKNASEVPMPCTLRSKHETSSVWVALSAGSAGIRYGVGGVVSSYKWMLENMEHSTDGGKTWKPCGVEE